MTNNNDTRFSEITPEIYELSKLCTENGEICPALYTQYQVNRGLRDINGNGVLTGLTEISEIQSSKLVDGKRSPVKENFFTAATTWRHW